MTRREEIDKIFSVVADDQRTLVSPLIDEVIFLEKQMRELRALPFVKIHPQNPALQKTTPAAKLYKESSQSYMNAIRILSSILRKVEASAADELMNSLEEFE